MVKWRQDLTIELQWFCIFEQYRLMNINPRYLFGDSDTEIYLGNEPHEYFNIFYVL